jgi:hypothetical protein
MANQIFTASRLSGDWIMPASVELAPTGVRYAQPKLIGGSEELIHYKHIASVRIARGMFFSTVSLETSGGSAPIVIKGLRNSDARALRDGIEAAQAER